MTKQERKNLISISAEGIWETFMWLKDNLHSPYVTAEFTVNNNYSIFAFEENDEENPEDRWVTLSIEKYNDKGRCVNDFVVSSVARTFSKTALKAAVSMLVKRFCENNDIDLLK